MITTIDVTSILDYFKLPERLEPKIEQTCTFAITCDGYATIGLCDESYGPFFVIDNGEDYPVDFVCEDCWAYVLMATQGVRT